MERLDCDRWYKYVAECNINKNQWVSIDTSHTDTNENGKKEWIGLF